jgi:adenosylmethionine-8-amino-7-oxononanoate aminotransferase
MSIVAHSFIVQCDHPGCKEVVTVQVGYHGKTIAAALKHCGWQPYHEFDYCPEHKRDV